MSARSTGDTDFRSTLNKLCPGSSFSVMYRGVIGTGLARSLDGGLPFDAKSPVFYLVSGKFEGEK